MKQFFESYGAVALGILALLVLIAMITPVGNIIKTSLQGTTETFSTRIESQTDTMTAQMQEAFESASTETHYDENGILLNGIINRTLYVNGVAYQNIWKQELNVTDNITWGWNKKVTPTGYRLESVSEIAEGNPYFGEVSYNTDNWKNVRSEQKYYFHEGYKYMIYATNPVYKSLLYNYWDENNTALGPTTWISESGAYQGKHEGIGSNKGIINQKYDALYFTLRIGTWGISTDVGSTYETDFMVFEVPSDLEIDLSSL